MSRCQSRTPGGDQCVRDAHSDGPCEPSRQLEVRTLQSFPCPFCSLDCGIAEIVSEGNKVAVTHVFPMCRQYETMTADDFLSATKASLRGAS